jgi:hypothetical protein
MTSLYETLWRFSSDGSVAGIASKTAVFHADGRITDIGIAQPMDYAQFGAALTDTDLVALIAALEAEVDARNG